MIPQVIIGIIAGVLSFGGQQIGKQKQYERDRETKIIQMRWDACEKLHQCQPLNDYLEPKTEIKPEATKEEVPADGTDIPQTK